MTISDHWFNMLEQAGYTGTLNDKMMKFTMAPTGPLIRSVGKPETMESSGTVGDYFLDMESLYICIAPNTWRYFMLLGWE